MFTSFYSPWKINRIEDKGSIPCGIIEKWGCKMGTKEQPKGDKTIRARRRWSGGEWWWWWWWWWAHPICLFIHKKLFVSSSHGGVMVMWERQGRSGGRGVRRKVTKMDTPNHETFLKMRQWRQAPHPRRLSWPMICGTQGSRDCWLLIGSIYYSLLGVLKKIIGCLCSMDHTYHVSLHRKFLFD